MNPSVKSLKQSQKVFGEEETEGAVYTIVIKKVCYGHHANIDFTEQKSHLEWETLRLRIIKAGTLEKLIESLSTDSGELETSNMNALLATYRSFASANQLLSAILSRYDQMIDDHFHLPSQIKEEHKKTLEMVLLVWLDMYPEDFYEPPQFLSLLNIREFAKKYCPGSAIELRARHRLSKYKKHGFIEVNKIEEVLNGMAVTSLAPTYISIFNIPDKDFALQLTYADNELFKKLLPYQCLGSVWSRRDKASNFKEFPSTVSATINQFNAVSLRVISTILAEPSLKAENRSRIIVKWINIAQELRLLKNFSSLKAITAALQSNSIHRLSRVWMGVPRDKKEIFDELANIFSADNNQTNCRNLLMKEGSAKFAHAFPNYKCSPKGTVKLPIDVTSTMQGTIPYLGTFLTDLTMIDAATPDHLSNGLINFEKKKKEFQILAQIKLLQSAANSYDIQLDIQFHTWFRSLQVFDEKLSYDISCIIETQDNNNQSKKNSFENVKSSVFKWTHKKSDSSSSSSSNGFFYDKNSNEESSVPITPKEKYIKMSKSCSNLSISPYSISNGTMLEQDFYIIKVSVEQKCCDIKGINVYKSILLNNKDRTRTVIKNAMSKHGIEGEDSDYMLVQLLPGDEIIFPESANVFYAVNPNHELKFLLRMRKKRK